MKVLFCASECVPFVKTGGLADVAGALPIALAKEGHDVRVILPNYRVIDSYWKARMEQVCSFDVLFGWETLYCGIKRVQDNGVTYYFVDNEAHFGVTEIYGDGISEGLRFAFFCRAVLECLPHIDFVPDVLHLNDWQTGLIAALLKTQYAAKPDYARIKTVFSIHNLKYQGIFSWREIAGRLGLEDRYFTYEYLEFFGCISCMKGGLVFADRLCTVSPTYAEINWTGLDFTPAQFDTVTSIDKAAWVDELKLHEELFTQLAYHLPKALTDTKTAFEKRLAA